MTRCWPRDLHIAVFRRLCMESLVICICAPVVTAFERNGWLDSDRLDAVCSVWYTTLKVYTIFEHLTEREREKQWKVLLSSALRFSKGHACLEGFELRPVVLVRAMCRRKWVWDIGGMIQTGQTPNYWEKNLFQWYFAHHKSNTDWPRIEPAPALWDICD
jgi:hypothetical protein